MNQAIPWRDYLSITPPLQPFERILVQAENFLEHLCNFYNFSDPVPRILIFSDSCFNAKATENDEIHLSQGLFTNAEIYADLATGEPERSDREVIISIKLRFILFWVLAHEFFHIARAHFDVYKLHGSTARKPIEFDADMMAVAGLYRYLRMLNIKEDAIHTKCIILDSIFWPMRAHIGSAFAEDDSVDPNYSTWHLRIWHAFCKLIQIDNWDGNSDLPEMAKLDAQVLFPFLKELDGAYCEHHRLDSSTFAEFLNEKLRTGNFGPLLSDWEAIQPSVQALERLGKCDLKA